MEVVTWSLAVIAISIILAQILRYVSKRVLPVRAFKIFDECLAAMQCSVAVLECGVIASFFGPWSWTAILSAFIFGTVKHYTFIKGKYFANPVSFVDRYYLAGKKSLLSPVFIFTVIAAQIIGSLLAHPISKLFWGKTYSLHHNRMMLMDCRTTLEVPFMQGLMVEFFTTFVAWATDSVTPIKWKPPVRSAVSVCLVLAFLKTSGAWMNPAMATAHTFNCAGHKNHWEHLIVYWLGPYMAAIMFFELKQFASFLRERRKHLPPIATKPVKMNSHEPDKENNDVEESQDQGLFGQLTAAFTPNINGNNPQTNYHRNPGGSLRQRVTSIGPG